MAGGRSVACLCPSPLLTRNRQNRRCTGQNGLDILQRSPLCVMLQMSVPMRSRGLRMPQQLPRCVQTMTRTDHTCRETMPKGVQAHIVR